MRKRSTMFAVLTGFLLGSAAVASADGVIRYKYTTAQPSNLVRNRPVREIFTFACQDIETGKLLDCKYTFKTIGLREPYVGDPPVNLINNGGHTHDYAAHPLPDPAYVESPTVSGGRVVSNIPEVAGVTVREMTLTAAPGYECVYDCFTPIMIKWVNYAFVRVGGLQELPVPGPGDYYHIYPDITTYHPERKYATPWTIEQLMKIAGYYYKNKDIPGRIMDVNDMSLPWGGVFDCDVEEDAAKKFIPGHSSHRYGTDVDLNRAPLGQAKIDCPKDYPLRDAVKKVAGSNEYPQLLDCDPMKDRKIESGKKHIDFDSGK